MGGIGPTRERAKNVSIDHLPFHTSACWGWQWLGCREGSLSRCVFASVTWSSLHRQSLVSVHLFLTGSCSDLLTSSCSPVLNGRWRRSFRGVWICPFRLCLALEGSLNVRLRQLGSVSGVGSVCGTAGDWMWTGSLELGSDALVIISHSDRLAL